MRALSSHPGARCAMTGNRGGGSCLLMVLGGIFLSVGAVFCFFFTVVPTMKWHAAQEWPAVDCTILQSDVREHDSDDGTTYSVHIQYRYVAEGQEFTSEQYNFGSGSSSGRAAKQRVVDAYPAGREATCYVDPGDPAIAVISREFSPGYLIGMFGLIFFIAGLLCLYGGMRPAPPKPIPTDPAISTSGTVELKPAQGPVAKLVVITVAALFWNGIVGFFIWNMISDWEGTPILFPIVMTLFGAAGIGLIAASIHAALALANPRPTFRMTPPAIHLAEMATLEWTFSGAVHRLERFEIWLIGQEEAQYRRGTDTVTDRQVFEKILVAQADNSADFRTGRVQFAVPEFTMPTFDGPNNKITWQLKAQGAIPRWPDVSEEYNITVLPLAIGAGRPPT